MEIRRWDTAEWGVMKEALPPRSVEHDCKPRCHVLCIAPRARIHGRSTRAFGRRRMFRSRL